MKDIYNQLKSIFSEYRVKIQQDEEGQYFLLKESMLPIDLKSLKRTVNNSLFRAKLEIDSVINLPGSEFLPYCVKITLKERTKEIDQLNISLKEIKKETDKKE